MEPERVALPKKPPSWLSEDDVRVAQTTIPHAYARRFYMDVSETALASVGMQAIKAMTEELGRHIVYSRQSEILQTADKFLMDHAWAAPIIEDELRKCVRQFVLSLWSTEEKKNLRDWFDLFTEKLK